MSDPHLDTKESRSFDGTTQPLSAARLAPLVYEELRRLAHRHLSREATGHTLTTTDVVHQAYLQLASQDRVVWQNESQFMAVAVTAIRRILVDQARQHKSLKRGGALERVPLDTANVPIEERADLLVALDDALERLAHVNPRQARVVECRFFAGMTEGETADVLAMSVRTVKRDWTKAKAWLYGEIFKDV
jgi:RNA polymerase sigma factor (TIGR02999 family)